MKSAKKSNYGELVRYITNAQNKHKRIDRITVTNCHDDLYLYAVKEIVAIQRQNTRAESDKTYHLLLSFPNTEKPAHELLQKIESSVCDSLGFGEHQRISAVHTDTDHLHIHIAINKIHPRRLTIHNPYYDHKVLGAICEKLEIQYSLERTNHKSHSRGVHSPALDMEHAGGVESLLGWIKRECLTEIRAAKSWEALHDVLQVSGLAIREQGNGLVITDRQGRAVKASSIGRDISKPQLEKRFGAFVQSAGASQPVTKTYHLRPMPDRQDTTALYAAYSVSQEQRAKASKDKILQARNRKHSLIEVAKAEARRKRAAIKLLTEGRLSKKTLYHLTSKTLKQKIEAATRQYHGEQKVIRTKYRRHTWLDWLQKSAVGGDSNALAVLRARKGGFSLKGNIVTGNDAGSDSPLSGLKPDSITKRGTIIYRVGAAAIRDDGIQFEVSSGITQKSLEISLHLAMRRFGPRIRVEGSATFKEQAVRLAAARQLPLVFEDAALEQQRKAILALSPYQEQKDDPATRSRITVEPRRISKRGRVGGRSRAGDGEPRLGATRANSNKPHVARVGSRPPPQSQNRLRDLSELDMVHIADRSAMLLPRDVPDHLAKQQAQPADGLRRPVPEPGRIAMNPGEAAAQKYIAEREAKRTVIKDIPRHTSCRPGQGSPAYYAGWREIDGRPLILLKTSEAEVIVMPVDAVMLSRMRRLKMGAQVTFNEDGMIRKKGRGL